MSADHGSVAKELERANQEFKEFERKDIKYREDLKHLKAKLKRLQDRLAKDSARMQVCSSHSLRIQLTDLLLLLLPVAAPCCDCRSLLLATATAATAAVTCNRRVCCGVHMSLASCCCCCLSPQASKIDWPIKQSHP